MKLTQILFILLSTMFFNSCGDNTLTSPLTEINSISLDDSNISIHSTDSKKPLTFTVLYRDGTTAKDSDSGVIWNSSDTSVFLAYIGSILATKNGGDANLTINKSGIFYASSPVHIKELISVEYSDVNVSAIGVAQTVYISGTFENNETNVSLETNIAYYSDENSTITDANATQFTLTVDTETPSIQIRAVLFEYTENFQEFNTSFN